MIRKMLMAAVLVACSATIASAAPTITAGNHQLLPNTPGQVISIFASGEVPADAVAGVDLFLVIGGGAEGPIVTNLDLIGAGTIFAASNTGQQDFGAPYIPPTREIVGITTTVSGTVNPNGVLAYLTLDTTGLASGDYTLSLTSDAFGSSVLYTDNGAPTSLINGTLSIVPEPSSVVLGLFGVVGVAAVAIRRRRIG